VIDQKNQQRRRQHGNSLIEALTGLAIMLFAILGSIGLQANLLRIGNESQFRMQAGILGQNIAGLIAVDAANVGCYALVSASAIGCTSNAAQTQAQTWRSDVLATLPNASEPEVRIGADGSATVTLRWQDPKAPARRNYVLVLQPL
jgi:Tfp pilus assembly protein PilV